ncbi:MAG: hypothetical protein IJ074_13505 [Clostridia bacterium]|nr:hypothetical protein [Clostridia bacterium]
MKKWLALLTSGLLLCGTAALAEGADYLYGTMRIPYDAFYAAEGVSISVDAVSSATNAKWKNEGLVGGTFNAPHTDDEGGDILGVVYPVAITEADLSAAGEAYGFSALDEAPAAYKVAEWNGEALSFSAVQGETAPVEAEASIATESKYGDYQIDVQSIHNSEGTSDIGTIYGVLLNAEGNAYALRHLENIWQDKLAFSAGFKTTESHGNEVQSENYAELMGSTIDSITYITDSGYHVLEANLYVPVKFDGGAAVEDAATADGKTALTLNNLPEDYAPVYSVKGLEISVEGEELRFENALPGAYTLTVADEGGVYADLLANFVLSTDEMPVVFSAEKNALVPADGADEALAEAFIANIAQVEINGETFAATGKGAVVVINADGEIDPEAAIVKGKGADATTTPVFAESGSYELTVTATGFEESVTFTAEIAK